MEVIKDFSEETLTQIRWWAWAGAVLPLTSLAGTFFIWAFGTKDLFDLTMAVGATLMFGIASTWWWWMTWTITRIVKKNKLVMEDLKSTTRELTEIKQLARKLFTKSDK